LLLEIRYDALGRRVESVEHVDPVDGSVRATPVVTRHVNAWLTVVEEYDVTDYGGGQVNHRLREFVWGEGFPEPVAMIDWSSAGDEVEGQSEVLHYLRDELGSVVGLTNEAGAVVERYAYDPYGSAYIEDTGTGQFVSGSKYGNPFLWTGQRYDAVAGLYHFLFRSYSPRLGRWLQRDPLEYIDGPSLVEYARSNPKGLVDPWGGWIEVQEVHYKNGMITRHYYGHGAANVAGFSCNPYVGSPACVASLAGAGGGGSPVRRGDRADR
jgi:RHS repeat-associated protein